MADYVRNVNVEHAGLSYRVAFDVRFDPPKPLCVMRKRMGGEVARDMHGVSGRAVIMAARVKLAAVES